MFPPLSDCAAWEQLYTLWAFREEQETALHVQYSAPGDEVIAAHSEPLMPSTAPSSPCSLPSFPCIAVAYHLSPGGREVDVHQLHYIAGAGAAAAGPSIAGTATEASGAEPGQAAKRLRLAVPSTSCEAGVIAAHPAASSASPCVAEDTLLLQRELQARQQGEMRRDEMR